MPYRLQHSEICLAGLATLFQGLIMQVFERKTPPPRKHIVDGGNSENQTQMEISADNFIVQMVHG